MIASTEPLPTPSIFLYPVMRGSSDLAEFADCAADGALATGWGRAREAGAAGEFIRNTRARGRSPP